MNMLKILICLVIGYFFGNISVSYIIGKTHNVDIRDLGSGNAGATNVSRVLGKKAGFAAFLGDALKGAFAIFLVRYLLYPGDDMLITLELITGIGAILGHSYPFWLEGRGGKGIATSGGVMFAFDWRLALVAIILFVLIVKITKYVSVASLTIMFLIPIWLIIKYPGEIYLHILGFFFVVFTFYRHRENIKRLINGTENKVGKKASQADSD